MDFRDWEPLYLKIVDRFGFSKENDEKAALWLSEQFKNILSGDVSVLMQTADTLKFKIRCRSVVVCGNAPSLEDELINYSETKCTGDLFIAADGAAAVLLKCGKMPDIIVTDLDGKHPNDAIKEIEAADRGALLLIHAHGDNLDKLEKYLPSMVENIKKGAVLPTCQCRPPEGLYNFGGFTDGDRCVFLADALGAEKITLIGFDFADPYVTDLKKKKLQCAEQLILLLNAEKETNLI